MLTNDPPQLEPNVPWESVRLMRLYCSSYVALSDHIMQAVSNLFHYMEPQSMYGHIQEVDNISLVLIAI